MIDSSVYLCQSKKMMDKKQQLIETAFSLFYRHGIHAVGINSILKQANVAKKTLYSYFDSKESLVNAVLAYRDDSFIDWLAARMQEQRAGKAALLAMFDALDDWFNDRVESLAPFNGCLFINTCSEYGDPATPQHQQCHQHKLRVRALIQQQVEALHLKTDKNYLVDMLAMLKEGAIVTAQVQGDRQAALKARQLAESLLEKV